tara:strand:- start:29744 stop:30301 length:558 start_codon:yes stop_codon:yes gene_type:complete
MVSTDDKEIAELAKINGANVPFYRSKNNSDDYATTTDVIKEVLNFYEGQMIEFQYGCCLYATSPFTTQQILRKSFLDLKENNLEVIFPVIKYSHPIQRALKLKENRNIEFLFEQNINKRTQNFKESYHDAGQFYWFDTKKIKKNKSLLSGKSSAFQVSALEFHDIDNTDDWKLAEIKYKHLNNLL